MNHPQFQWLIKMFSKLFYSQLWFITVKDRLKSAIEKCHRIGSRRTRFQVPGVLSPMESCGKCLIPPAIVEWQCTESVTKQGRKFTQTLMSRILVKVIHEEWLTTCIADLQFPSLVSSWKQEMGTSLWITLMINYMMWSIQIKQSSHQAGYSKSLEIIS